MTKVDIRRLDSVTNNDTTATTLINDNFAALQEAIENTLSRDGTTPNFMDANLDMNSYRIINGGDAVEDSDYVTLRQFDEKISEGEEFAARAEAAAAQSESSAQSARMAAQECIPASDRALEAATRAEDARDTAVEYGEAAISAKEIAVASAESASESARIAEDLVTFGVVRGFFEVSDWALSNGKYSVTYPYNVITGVYKKVDDSYTLATNIDIVSGELSTVIYSQEPFEGYALLTNQLSDAPSTFIFEQAASSDTWEINHYLNRYPSVTVVDSAGTTFNAKVEYNSLDKCTVYINGATTGKAYLN